MEMQDMQVFEDQVDRKCRFTCGQFFLMHSSVVGGQIGAEMNVHGSRATGWSSGWKWNSSICKVGVAVEAARLIQALERGWALGRHHVGAGVLLVGNCLAAYPPPMLDPPPAVLQIH